MKRLKVRQEFRSGEGSSVEKGARSAMRLRARKEHKIEKAS